ncbi:MAG: BlaI/MecI/CopY family transcriptional regulator [Gemmatimonadetes bacterium]|nr:BlaI/MecI/CopY family transcriptional regulator [Gemmatimonadota bacterium]MYD14804.1 BlaI/MecI/CopY family transcriptional regulator [Gemmatimonadota bacterium]MYI67181.1 BlaI/MecI/CopY family transcriptional regulator [Gemmatimonadota bacterium]
MTHMPPLSRRERQVMDIVHELGSATAARIRERMTDPPSYSAVRSVLRILVDKGHLAAEYDGPRLVYSPTVPVHRARRSVMRHVLRTFFDGSVEGAVNTLLELEDTQLTPEERARMKKLIDRASGEGR